VIKDAKRNKSVGLDNLPYEIFKGNSSFAILTLLFNKMYNSNLVPSVWKMSLVKPIPKNSMTDPHIPLQYRGISLLSTVYKLFTSVLNSRIQSVAERHNLLADEQNGFRSNRSCEDHIFTLTSIIRNRKKDKLDTFVTFIDFEKAFDRVDRKLLFYKMQLMGFGGKLVSVLKTLYENSSLCLNINGFISPSFESKFGVKQGDSISPTLFNLYINDLIYTLNACDSGIRLTENTHVSALLYADDLAIIADSEQSMKKQLDALTEWCRKWRLVVNAGKTKIVHFRSPARPRSTFEFILGNNIVEYVNQYKYLGIILDENLLFNVTASVLAKAGSRALGSIHNKFNKLKGLGFHTYSKLFHTGIAPILDYCSGIWGYQNFGYLDTVQNRAIRFFLGIHRFAPNLAVNGDAGWVSCTTRRRTEMLRFWNRIVDMSDSRLTKKVFMWDYSKRTNKGNWNSDVYKLFSKIDKVDIYRGLTKVDIQVAKGLLIEQDKLQWYDNMQSVSKLNFYKLFKNDFCPESYIFKIHNRAHRSVFAQLRCGILPLKIETGRYTQIPMDYRLCIFCNENVIENEMHFLFQCNFYSNIRINFWPKFINRCDNFDQMNNIEKVKIMMSNNVLKVASEFIYECYCKRKSYLYQ
jgi:hypothetical protein